MIIVLQNDHHRKDALTLKIGFFDSGIGGLTVLRLARRKLPDADFLYYADVDNVPYGEKTGDEVRALTLSAARFLTDLGAEAVVLACNTATSAAAAPLREVLSVPVVGMEPAVKKALDEHPHGRVLVAATPFTCRGDKLRRLIDQVGGEELVDMLPLPGLVHLAERCDFSPEAVDPYLRGELRRFDLARYDSVVLGCTHFLYFTDAFRRLLPAAVRLVDGNDGTVNQLLRVVGPCTGGGSVTFFDSGRPASPESLKKTRRLLERLDELESTE